MTKESNTIISVQDYGPIAEAKDIELCPLTVFVGPSNTGKSYLATLVYALFKSFESGPVFRRDHRMMRRFQSRQLAIFKDDPMVKKLANWLRKSLKENTKNLNLSDAPEEIQKWINGEMSKMVSENFHQEISRCMGLPQEVNNLIGAKFKLSLEDDLKKLVLNPFNMVSSMEIKKPSMESRELQRLRRHVADGRKIPISIHVEMFFDSIPDEILHPHGESECFYLPAARTGIMQSHRAIAGALVRRAPFAGLEDVSVPTLSGIVADFLQEIILMNTGRILDRKVMKVAQGMEENILCGSIESEISERNQYPQFLYKQKGIEVPLLRASSMVSELAPVVLFLKHRVGEGDLVIIEEPEAHLHPEAQREITKTIVQLVRAGVRVMVTTHSDYVLEQLSNHVRQSKLKDKKGLFLDEKEIGAYSFTPKKKGTVVKRLKFTNENGLSPDDHDKVSSDLYNETVEILDRIDAEK